MKGRILTEKIITDFSAYLKSEEKVKHHRKISAGCAGVRRMSKWCRGHERSGDCL